MLLVQGSPEKQHKQSTTTLKSKRLAR